MSGPNESKSVIVAANPFSGQRGNRRLVERLSAALVAGGLEPRVIWDQAERKELLGRAGLAREYRCIIVAGGDGTVGDVLNEQPALPLAVAPLGTENLFAKEFGFTHDMDRVDRICDLILARGIRKQYVVNARLEIARRPDVLRKMERAGFLMLLLGIESAHDKTLRSMRKGFDVAKIREFCGILRHIIPIL